MNSRFPTYGTLAFPLLAGIVLRILLVQWGLPDATRWYPYHPDELDVAKAVYQLDFLGGQFNPHFFNYPSLFLYLTYFVHGVIGLFGLTQSPPQEWTILHEIILCGRIVSVAAGAATVAAVYFLSLECLRHRDKEAGGQAATPVLAGLGALLLALLPGHVMHSAFATVDITAALFTTLTLLFATRALRSEVTAAWRFRQLLLSAALAGLATATKYNAVIVLAAPLVSCLLIGREKTAFATWKRLLAVPAVALAGFVLGCPGAVFSFSEFLGDGRYSGFVYELLVHPREGSGDVFTNTGNGWLYHLSLNLPYAATLPVVIITGIAMLTIVAGEQRRLFAPLLAFALLYFLSLGFSQVRFMRYVLPLLPVACVFCGAGLGMSLHKRIAKAARPALAVFFALIPAFPALALSRSFSESGFGSRPDPRDEAATWMKMQTASATEPVTIGLLNNPWFFTPPLVKQDARPGTPPAAVEELLHSNPAYALTVIGLDTGRLAQEKPQYVVMNDFEWRDKLRLKDPAFLEFFRVLKRDYRLKQCFGRYAGPTLAGVPGADELVTTEPHDYIYTNPQVRIYERRN